MQSTPEPENLFYQNLGKLFYAIAAADKAVRKEEVNILKQIVNTEWLFLVGTNNKIEIDSMRQIKIIFNQLTVQKQNANDCFTEFKSFKITHENLFTTNVKQQIWKTANAIVTAFSRRNKSELVMLTELGAILKS